MYVDYDDPLISEDSHPQCNYDGMPVYIPPSTAILTLGPIFLSQQTLVSSNHLEPSSTFNGVSLPTLLYLKQTQNPTFIASITVKSLIM